MANESRMMQEANERALMEGILPIPIYIHQYILTTASQIYACLDRDIEIVKRQASLAIEQMLLGTVASLLHTLHYDDDDGEESDCSSLCLE